MPWILNILLLIIIIILYIKYKQKHNLDYTERVQLETEIANLHNDAARLKDIIDERNTYIQNLDKYSEEAIERYNNSVRDRTVELEIYFEQQKKRRSQILDEDMEIRRQELETNYKTRQTMLQLEEKRMRDNVDSTMAVAAQQIATAKEQAEQAIATYDIAVEEMRGRFDSLLKPLLKYEMEKEQRRFYTIQLPEEYQEDIEFLLTTVAAKVQHPDIISKLVWAEYVKPYLDDTFRRIEIQDAPGIYKLTNINNGKAYIGKSTNVKKRIADHLKSSVGCRAIADQAVHHEILKSGFWNWTIEVITYCEKDKLSELEKFYIDFFKTQEFGFNKNAGGGG